MESVFKICAASLFAMVLAAVAAHSPPAANEAPGFENPYYRFAYDLDRGAWSLYEEGGNPLIVDARARVTLKSAHSMLPGKKIDSAELKNRSFTREEIKDSLGTGEKLTVTCRGRKGPGLTSVFRFYPDRRFFTVSLRTEGLAGMEDNWRVSSLEPFILEGPSAGMFLGPDPEDDLILENGSNLYLDFMVSMYRAGDGPPMPAKLFSRNSKSNCSSVIYDPDSGRSALAGFLGANETGLVIAGLGRGTSHNGMKGFTHYGATWKYRPPQPTDREFRSGEVYLDLFAPTPFDALEDYGDALAKRLGVEPWEGDVPTGWNSWGEYFSDIDEKIVLENLDFAAKNFLPYGMKYFQIDSGYSPFWGDWEADHERFPHGMKWMADKIREAGMIPGIWIAPVNADVRSETFSKHPDWFLPRGGLKQKLLAGDPQMRLLDLSLPEVREHIASTVRKYTQDWGYRWLKVDFAYQFLMHDRCADMSRSMPHWYRETMRMIKKAAGPETFVVGIGMTGLNYGLVDADRLGLDDMPAWSNQKSMWKPAKLGFAQGLVPSMRVAARRYWMNRRVWINHPDLIFFNNDRWPDWGPRPLTADESLCLASAVGLSGGIVKIGDRMVDMTEAEAGVIRKLLPVYKGTARPLDLFEMTTPEVWDLEVEKDFEKWHVAGLFNWGENWTPEGRHIPEETRKVSVGFEDLGLDPAKEYLAFDFWNQEFLGAFSKGIEMEIAPREVRVLCIREKRKHPWVISSNRHITQGGVELQSLKWDPESLALIGVQAAVPGHEYRLYFYCPKGFRLVGAKVNGKTAEAHKRDELVVVSFILKEPRAVWRIEFEKQVVPD